MRSFKGIALIDIREFYSADGDEKPGKKGISLTLEQVRRRYPLQWGNVILICAKWETLKIGSPVIDGLFESLQKKK